MSKKFFRKMAKIGEQMCGNAISVLCAVRLNDREYLEVVISDLTYVRVRDKWCYICLLIDLFNREIIGYSAVNHKDARLVYDAF